MAELVLLVQALCPGEGVGCGGELGRLAIAKPVDELIEGHGGCELRKTDAKGDAGWIGEYYVMGTWTSSPLYRL